MLPSLELILLSLRRSEKEKDAHCTSAALTSNQMYLLACCWHSGSRKLPTPTLLQSDGMNSRAVLYCMLAYRLSTYESIHLKLSFQITAQFLAHASPFLLVCLFFFFPSNFLVCSSHLKQWCCYWKMNGYIAVWGKCRALLVWVLSNTSCRRVCVVGMQ